MIDIIVARQGINFSVQRNGDRTHIVKGAMNCEKATNRKYITFLPDTDVKAHDCFITPDDALLYITETEIQYIQGKRHQLKAFYETESERSRKQNPTAAVSYNIGTVNHSIIGNQGTATLTCCIEPAELYKKSALSDDKQQLDIIISLLEDIQSGKLDPQKAFFHVFAM